MTDTSVVVVLPADILQTTLLHFLPPEPYDADASIVKFKQAPISDGMDKMTEGYTELDGAAAKTLFEDTYGHVNDDKQLA